MNYEDCEKVWRYWNDLRFGPWEISVILSMPLNDVVEMIEVMHDRALLWNAAFKRVIEQAVLLNATMLERSFMSKEDMV